MSPNDLLRDKNVPVIKMCCWQSALEVFLIRKHLCNARTMPIYYFFFFICQVSEFDSVSFMVWFPWHSEWCCKWVLHFVTIEDDERLRELRDVSLHLFAQLPLFLFWWTPLHYAYHCNTCDAATHELCLASPRCPLWPLYNFMPDAP